MLGLVALTGLVAAGALRALDRALLDLVQVPHAAWLDIAGSAITILGQSEVVGTVALGVAIVRRRAGRADWWVPLALAAVVAVEVALKLAVAQAPPPRELSRSLAPIPFLESPVRNAFPSGHLARVAFMVTALRWPGWTASLGVLLMAITRVYLAEHWPSDVLGGWLLGYGIATISIAPSPAGERAMR